MKNVVWNKLSNFGKNLYILDHIVLMCDQVKLKGLMFVGKNGLSWITQAKM